MIPRAPALLVFLAVLLAVAAWPARAIAQSPVDVSSLIDTNEVEIGEVLTYTLQATSSTNDSPTNPQLAVHPGFAIVDQSVSPTHMMTMINGRTTERFGLTATWALRADQLGTFTIGPGTVTVKSARFSGRAQVVRVLAPGTSGGGRGRRSRRRGPGAGGGIFDPFAGMFGNVDPEPPSDPLANIISDPRLAMHEERSPIAFLHATVDRTHAVVGEQVVLTVYLYEDLQQHQGRPSDVHEATATDFVKRLLVQDETRAVHVGDTTVAGRPWSVKLVRKNALFPLKTGRLAIAPMSLTLPQARVGLRESETLFVDVTEPPIAGRPAGYQIGDTGDFSLSATTTPRRVEQHGAIGVTIELRGNGNMPATLAMPEVQGVEWLEPQVQGNLGPIANDRWGGVRTFAYIARIHRAGAVDLGEVRIPYWDPQARAYAVAHAGLGIVDVSASAGRDAGADVAEVVLPNLPKPRAALEGRPSDRFLTERPIFWTGIFGAPFACAAAIVLGGAVRRLRERRAAAAPSPDRVARARRAEAETAVKGDDGGAAVAAVLRAIEAEVLRASGVNVRGTDSQGALAELVDAGVPEPAAKALVETIAACEAARYAPAGVPIEKARELWARATAALADLPPPSGGAA